MKRHYQIFLLLVAGLPLWVSAAEADPSEKKAEPVAATNAVAVASTNATVPSASMPTGTNAVSTVKKVVEAVSSEKKADTELDEAGADKEEKVSTNVVATVGAKINGAKFERYKTILDRMPFGPEPVGFNPDSGTPAGGAGGAALSEEQAAAQAEMEAQQMLQGVRISALNVTPRGSVAVGFTDSSKQPAASYYMKVGETRDGWTIKAADAKEMTVTLARDGVEGTLKLGEGADPNAKGGKGGMGGNRPGLMNRPTPGGNMMGGRPSLMNRPTMGGGRFGGMGGAGGGMPQANESAGDALSRLRARRAQKDADAQAERARAAAAAEQARQDREKEAAERERAAADRQQQLEALKQVQEELRRQREEAEQQRQQQLQQQQQQQNNGAAPADGAGT